MKGVAHVRGWGSVPSGLLSLLSFRISIMVFGVLGMFYLHLARLSRSQLGAWSFYEVWNNRRSLDEMRLLLVQYNGNILCCVHTSPKEINNFCWGVI